MNLNESEIRLFYKLWYSLVWGVNEKHKVIPRFKKPVYGTRVATGREEFIKIRDAMWASPEWIDEFLKNHDNGEFTEQERSILTGWRRYFVRGKFIVVKHTAKYSVLMTPESGETLLYGVCGISDPIRDTFDIPVPFLGDFVLLPFEGRIIYDSLVSTYSMSFGPGMRSSIKEWYDESYKKYGIIETLNGEEPVVRRKAEKPPKKTSGAKPAPEGEAAVPDNMKVPQTMAARYAAVAEILSRFSDENLNGKYKEIFFSALAKLCRKRPSPLVKGWARTWACGIVLATGSNRLLFGESDSARILATETDAWFGISAKNADKKAYEAAFALGIRYEGHGDPPEAKAGNPDDKQ